MNPLIKALKELGGSGTIEEIYNKVTEIVELSDEQLETLHDPEKGSQTGQTAVPDANENPEENIFSDIQQTILDTSNDAKTTMNQNRISAHLRGRCRRKKRRIWISYLPDSQKIR